MSDIFLMYIFFNYYKTKRIYEPDCKFYYNRRCMNNNYCSEYMNKLKAYEDFNLMYEDLNLTSLLELL